MNGDGTYTVLPDAETTVMLNINSEEKPLAKNNVLIYPNPVKQELNVFLNGKEKISGYTIFNSLGKVMDNKAVNKANNLKIHLNSYNNGVYFIKIYTDNKKTYTKKIEILN